MIEAEGRYLLPGLVDGHMHVESGMVTVTEFARAVIPHGTTAMFIDPHEIANVLGLAGVKLMHDEAMGLPINVYVQMPSCVPSAPGLETPGAEIGPAEVAEAMGWPNIIGLGEMMNFPGVVAGDPKMLAEMAATARAGKVIGGHYASPDLGRAFHAYAAGGPADDHEGTRAEDAIARVRAGHAGDAAARLRLVRCRRAGEGDPGKPRRLQELHPLHRRQPFGNAGQRRPHGPRRPPRHRPRVGPDHRHPDGDLNAAQHFGVEREIGSIAPGRRADIVISSDLVTLPIETVIAAGRVVAEHGQLLAEIPPYAYPASVRGTVRLKAPLTARDFDIAAPPGANQVKARVIGIVENQAPTKALERTLGGSRRPRGRRPQRRRLPDRRGRAPPGHRPRRQRLRFRLRLRH